MKAGNLAKESRDLGTCTAIDKTGQRCEEDATRPGIPDIHKDPLCDRCRKRLHRQNTKACSQPGCPNNVKNGKSKKERYKPKPWCRLHEHRALAADTIGETERTRVKQDFVAKIESNWLTGCWEWCGRVSGGYGHYKGRKAVGEWKAHRLAWHLFNGGHGRNEVLDHLCVNSRCVNPLHLKPATQNENVDLRDQRSKNPDYVWHDNQGQQIFLPLLAFASLHRLVFRTADNDYSRDWDPVDITVRELSATRVESIRLADVQGPSGTRDRLPSPEQLKLTQKLDINKDKTLHDLSLSGYEAEYLASFKQLGRPRRTRRRDPSTESKPRSPLWMDTRI